MDTAILFVDAPLTPIQPWELTRWKKLHDDLSGLKSLWRLLLVIVPELASQARCTPCVRSGMAWERYGAAIRAAACSLCVDCDTAFLYDYSSAWDITSEIASQGDSWIGPPYVGSTGDLFRRLPLGLFPEADWPLRRCMSGSGILLRGRCELDLELQRLLDASEFEQARKLLHGWRNDPAVMSGLLTRSRVLIYADELDMPETADPWFFLSCDLDVNAATRQFKEVLQSYGLDVQISRSIDRYWNVMNS